MLTGHNPKADKVLTLLPPKEREEVLRYFHVQDAKMALFSRLLKRYAIARYAGVPWEQAVATRNSDTKPVYCAPDGSEPLIFNVSHQAGLVVLVAVVDPPPGFCVGVDVVCATERRRRDHEMVRAEGWPSFVDMHADVLGQAEATALRNLPQADGLDGPLRRFYALWCLREAYVKMTGEALLAPWLRDLEMRSFCLPSDDGGPAPAPEVWFRGRPVNNVDLCLVNFLGEFMICTAARMGTDGMSLSAGDYVVLDVEEVLSFAKGSRS